MNFRTLTIDPGVRACGWAGWGPTAPGEPGRLGAAGVSRVRADATIEWACREHTEQIPRGAAHVVIESMAWRPGDARSNPNDLIAVQTVAAFLAGRMGGFLEFVPAATWKGTIPKGVHHERIRAVLEEGERRILEEALAITPKAHHKEILDAIGIGLYYSDRINRGGGARR